MSTKILVKLHWLPNDDLTVSEDWHLPGLLQLKKSHAELISKYRCQEGPDPASSQDPADARASLASPRLWCYVFRN